MYILHCHLFPYSFDPVYTLTLDYPVEPVVFNIKQRGKVIQVYVVFQSVFPIPKCKASTYVRTSENVSHQDTNWSISENCFFRRDKF